MRLLAALFLFLPFAVFAADEPEVVYGRFHRAIAAADLDEAGKHSIAARRAELASMSQAQREAQIKMMSMMLPRAFSVMSKNVTGQSARLVVTGPGRPMIEGAAPQQMYGQIRMASENGEWKVDEVNWSDEKPAGVAAAVRQGAGPQTKPAAQKPGTRTEALAPEQPVRKLGTAKQECVYKPVMTQEDLERCR